MNTVILDPLNQKNDLALKIFIQAVKNLPSLAEKKGITLEELRATYELGVQFYELGYYEESIKVFRSLAYLSTKTALYWQGLAYSYQQLGNYEKALKSFLLTFLLGEKNQEVSYSAALTSIAVKNFDLAIYFLSFINEDHPLFSQALNLKNLSSYQQSLTRVAS